MLPDGSKLWSRYAHWESTTVKVGDIIVRGQSLGVIGNASGTLPYHLHFDISKKDLGLLPSDWPGMDLVRLKTDYVDPKVFIKSYHASPAVTVKAGLHMAARGGDQLPVDWQAFDTAKLQAIKFLSNHALSDIQAGVQRVGASNVYFRMYADPSDPAMQSGTTFFSVHRGWLDQLYALGVTKWEIGNEPNTDLESGNWLWWNGASAFANWYRACAKLIRLYYPKAQIMWPGLSPQPNVPAWIAELKTLIAERLVDLIGCHSYWQFYGSGTYGIDAVEDGGLHYTKYLGLGRPVVITEASNNSFNVDFTQKGYQYNYYLKRIPAGVEAVLFFVSSTANLSYGSEAWAGTSIPSIVGSR